MSAVPSGEPVPRESMEFDVVVVGGGPAGLAAAIRIKQLAAESSADVSVCLIEKGSEIGAHILSGAVMDPRGLTELFPDWKEKGAPVNTPVTEDRFQFLTRNGSWRFPNFLLPACLHNDGNYVISLGNLCRWLGQQAETLGVEIYAGFAGAEVLYDDNGAVKGVATSDMGIGKDGKPTEAFQRGVELHAKYTLFAEGCRGQLGRQLEARFKLHDGADPFTRQAGHYPTIPTVVRFYTIWKTIKSRSAWLSGLVIRIRFFRRLKSFSATRPIRRFDRSSKAVGASATVRARLRPVDFKRYRNWYFQAVV